MYAMKNIPEDPKAWVTITIILVIIDTLLYIRKGTATITIWTTDDKAIITLISIFVTQISLTLILPNTLSETITSIKLKELNKGINRINPIPPNFNKMPANSIDPKTGASTWAFGNHRWIKYIGSLTINPPIKNIVATL